MTSSVPNNVLTTCSGACWYEIVFPVAIFAVVFVTLTVFCKCFKEIYKKCIRIDRESEEEGQVNEGFRLNREDLPPSYSSVQIALPRSETFPVEDICNLDTSRIRLPAVTTSESFTLPAYDDVIKMQKQSAKEENYDVRESTLSTTFVNEESSSMQYDETAAGSSDASSRIVVFEL